MYAYAPLIGQGRYEYLRTNTHTRTQRTYPHAYACHKDGCLHINKKIAITRKAITAFTSLLNFGASFNATIHTNTQNIASHVVQNKRMKNPSTDAADARTYNHTLFVIERTGKTDSMAASVKEVYYTLHLVKGSCKPYHGKPYRTLAII
jgi:hypothetical protein